ncbi:hypothetical protein L7F22_052382 [Adiantum nelumboides]|nr:hypothetical protein [Adiantum nelumboides]
MIDKLFASLIIIAAVEFLFIFDERLRCRSLSALNPDGAQLGVALAHAASPVDLSHATGAFAVLLVVDGHAGAAAHVGDANGALVVELLAGVSLDEEGVGGTSGTADAIEGLNLGGLTASYYDQQTTQRH